MKNRSKNNYSNSNKTELTIFSIIRGRSSHRRYSIAKAILKNFAQNSRENTCVTASFLIKLQACLWHRCFPVNFGKILRTTFLQNTSLAVASMKNTISPPVKLKQLSVIFILNHIKNSTNFLLDTSKEVDTSSSRFLLQTALFVVI